MRYSSTCAIPFGQNFPILDYFNDHLPNNPYCTNDPEYGVRIRQKSHAMHYRYIQPNPPYSLGILVFDVDRHSAALDWYNRDCPAPNLTVMNPANGHAHLIYALKIALCRSPYGSLQALKYFAAIERALCLKLAADLNYSGLICQNPNHPCWRVAQWQENLYTFDWLEDYLDLSAGYDALIEPNYGLGRNCTVFEKTRTWSYPAIRRRWPDYREWFDCCFEKAMGYNAQFPVPLSAAEVGHLAKSVAQWTHRHLTEKSFAEYVDRTHTPEIQAARGRKSHGGGRPEGSVAPNSERQLKPWIALGISESSYYRYKKIGLL